MPRETETVTSSPGDRKTEFFLKLTTERIGTLEAALERNWIAHLLLAGVGAALVIPIGKFRDLAAQYFIRGLYDQTVVSMVLLAIQLYYFMKLGHLLTLYLAAAKLLNRHLQAYAAERTDPGDVVVKKSTNFYVEAILATKPLSGRDDFWSYMLVTTATVTLSQATSLYLAGQAFGLNRWVPFYVALSGGIVNSGFTSTKIPASALARRRLSSIGLAIFLLLMMLSSIHASWAALIIVTAEALMVTLYILFWSSNKEFPQTQKVVGLSPALAVLWLAIFAVTRR